MSNPLLRQAPAKHKSNTGKLEENEMIVKLASDISRHLWSKSLFRTPFLSPLVTCLTYIVSIIDGTALKLDDLCCT